MRKYLLKTSKSSITKARRLRKNMTECEKKLWSLLRHHLLQVPFRRQVPVGPYILDFLCPQAKLVVELDGSQHYDAEVREYDFKREEYLKSQGLMVLRFNDREFLNNPRGVVQVIFEEVQKRVVN